VVNAIALLLGSTDVVAPKVPIVVTVKVIVISDNPVYVPEGVRNAVPLFKVLVAISEKVVYPG
jgi:hypothetical protein